MDSLDVFGNTPRVCHLLYYIRLNRTTCYARTHTQFAYTHARYYALPAPHTTSRATTTHAGLTCLRTRIHRYPPARRYHACRIACRVAAAGTHTPASYLTR